MEKVVVGMSGGVDSSVAAYLLKEQGYDVIGVTMQIWQDEDICSMEENGGCCGLSAVEDARRVASALNIPYYVMNFKQEFKENVIDYFVAEYLQARTPNPCIACNRYVKWESLLKRSMDIGASYIATGHYASIEKLNNGRYAIKKSVTRAKDQTYALYNLTQFQLEHTLMPVGAYAKDEIRAMANQLQLPVANKPDSQEICFVSDNNYAGFISDYLNKEDDSLAGSVKTKNAKNIMNTTSLIKNQYNGLTPGNFINTAGEVIGQHRGLIHYTIGQRKGLNLAMGQPVFVLELRPETNEVVIGNSNEVFTDRLYANRLNFMAIEDIVDEITVEAKIRYSHKGARCRVKRTAEDEVLCIFEEPQRAITPGQAVVFYQDDYVVGGGTIMSKR
ncbi:tRNA 2-thiouridine(34) synthase MnmA [Mobilitalea sibirica]|uniref:tRNA-specific 2-thiouridylase MnmA n=1 Tax=Mobilitalea sibirica TaxID=1462919 RepID=A0A8J7KZG2_9FIRM|nr:tRNA 2-thiouridine(34) synthase MnmA [Mobilitalea sibirica]MBH1940143.1 tRNA 2-thiouridine(34) synthase MnmA [Mobilitalea sibirica]